MTYFVVLHEPGPNWDPQRPMRQQAGWDEHAAFMDQLADEGTIVLGGPIGTAGSFDGGHRAMLVFNVESEEAVRAILAGDPWAEGRMSLLAIASINPWQILLGNPPPQ